MKLKYILKIIGEILLAVSAGLGGSYLNGVL